MGDNTNSTASELLKSSEPLDVPAQLNQPVRDTLPNKLTEEPKQRKKIWKKLLLIPLVIVVVFIAYLIVSFAIGFFTPNKVLPFKAYFNEDYYIEFEMPYGYDLYVEEVNEVGGVVVMVREVLSGNPVLTFSFNPYLAKSYVDEKDGTLYIDQIKFIITDNKEISCPIYAIFPENTMNQPYTYGFNISTQCDDSTRDSYMKVQNMVLSSLRLSPKLKEVILADSAEGGILNPQFKTTTRSINDTKKLLEEYASKIDVTALSSELEPILKDYSEDGLFSLSYEVLNGSMHPLVKEPVLNPFEKDSALYTINDPILHKYMYEYLRSFYPTSVLDNIQYIFFGTDGLHNNLAWVAPTEERTFLILYVDILDLLDSLKNLDGEFFSTLIHESAHALMYWKMNVDIMESNACSTYFIEGWGCVFESSYFDQYNKKFWVGKYTDRKVDLETWEERRVFMRNYPNDFVSEYATTNASEDFAESLLSYTLSDDLDKVLSSGTIKGEKFQFFQDVQGLYFLRNYYRKNLGRSYDVSIDSPSTTLEKIPVDKYLSTLKNLIYPNTEYINAEKVNDCGDGVTEGDCEYISYYWGTDDSVDKVLNWYVKTPPSGWKMNGDMINNGYAVLENESTDDEYMFFVKESSLFDLSTSKKTIILFNVWPD